MRRKSTATEKQARGRAGEFRVASELCRRNFFASLTMGNVPNVDVLCSNSAGTKAICIQVKTFRADGNECAVGKNAEKNLGENFFWILVGLRDKDCEETEERFYIIPAKDMAENVTRLYQSWLVSPGKDGKQHHSNDVRKVRIGKVGSRDRFNFDVSKYKDCWNYIEDALNGERQ